MNRKQRELAGIAICVASVATFWIRSPDHLTSSCFYAACAWSITADWLLGRMPFLKKNITEIPKSIMQGQFGTSHTAVTRIMSRGAVILVLVGVANFFYS